MIKPSYTVSGHYLNFYKVKAAGLGIFPKLGPKDEVIWLDNFYHLNP
jgi:hypothetical protein